MGDRLLKLVEWEQEGRFWARFDGYEYLPIGSGDTKELAREGLLFSLADRVIGMGIYIEELHKRLDTPNLPRTEES